MEKIKIVRIKIVRISNSKNDAGIVIRNRQTNAIVLRNRRTELRYSRC